MDDFDRELDWVRRHMPKLRRAVERLPDLGGMRLACNMHLDIKMAPLVEELLERGAAVYLTTCNAWTVRDPVVEYLRGRGAEAEAWCGMDDDSYHKAIATALDWGPTHLCEMGAELSVALAARHGSGAGFAGGGVLGRGGFTGGAGGSAGGGGVLGRGGFTGGGAGFTGGAGGEAGPAGAGVRAGLEATGSGISRLEGLEPGYPIYNWDDLPVKEGLHNRRMVGLTAWHVFFERTGLTLHDMRVLVVGYGSVGRGVAESARAYGGTVTVSELDPGRRLEAAFAGWNTGVLEGELPKADVVITATGARNVISERHFPLLKPGVFLVNVGHVAHEIDVASLERYPKEQLFEHVDEYRLPAGAGAAGPAGGGDSAGGAAGPGIAGGPGSSAGAPVEQAKAASRARAGTRVGAGTSAAAAGRAAAAGADKRVYLLAGGSMLNLTAGRGDSINAFDVTLAVLTGGVGYIAGAGAERAPGLYVLPDEAWRDYVTES